MKLYFETILIFFVSMCYSKPLPQGDDERSESQLAGGGVPNQTSGGTADLSQPGQSSSGFNTVLASGMGGLSSRIDYDANTLLIGDRFNEDESPDSPLWMSPVPIESKSGVSEPRKQTYRPPQEIIRVEPQQRFPERRTVPKFRIQIIIENID